MEASFTEQVAIIGCGPAGCAVISILKESSAPAYLVAVDDSAETIDKAEADRKVLVKPGEKLDVGFDLSKYPVILFALEPSEGSSLTYAQAIATAAPTHSVYTFGFLIKPSSGWKEDEKLIYSSFDGAALVDEGWVLKVRKGQDPEYSMRISLNFTAHMLRILAEAFSEHKLNREALRSMTSGRVSTFAATATSEPETLYSMTMSPVDRSKAKSLLLFMPEDTENVLARRIFLAIAYTIPPNAEIQSVRVKGVEPFRILAMLSS